MKPTDADMRIAGEVCEAWRRNPGMAGEPDLQTRIATAMAHARESERIATLNEVNHIMNWDADECCKCFTKEHPKRNPRCQYHALEDLLAQATRARGEKGDR